MICTGSVHADGVTQLSDHMHVCIHLCSQQCNRVSCTNTVVVHERTYVIVCIVLPHMWTQDVNAAMQGTHDAKAPYPAAVRLDTSSCGMSAAVRKKLRQTLADDVRKLREQQLTCDLLASDPLLSA